MMPKGKRQPVAYLALSASLLALGSMIYMGWVGISTTPLVAHLDLKEWGCTATTPDIIPDEGVGKIVLRCTAWVKMPKPIEKAQ